MKQKNKKDEIRVMYDYQAFAMQRFGGISRYFCEIIDRLSCEYRIPVLFSINYYLLQRWRKTSLIPLPRFVYKNLSKHFLTLNRSRMKKLLRRKADGFLFHPTYYDPYFLQYIGDRPYVITVHDMIHEKFSDYFADAEEVIRQKKEVIGRATRIIAVSENTKKDVVELLGVAPDKIDVIYHSTDMKCPESDCRLELPERYLLFVGDRSPYKNFGRFVEAFALLHAQDPSLHIVHTGGRLSKSEQELLARNRLTEVVHHVKASDREMSELYARALLFVYPSLYEGFGIPILEAYACRCPIAISNTSCFPEIAGEAAAYFDPYSAESMSKVMSDVIGNESLRLELIRKGEERLKAFSWETSAGLTEETYRKAIGK